MSEYILYIQFGFIRILTHPRLQINVFTSEAPLVQLHANNGG
jgi:hypothetical protein